ncbi:hypothetical protein [Roseibacillus ishigakijimensis]|uniref:PH domain-containing protein n=1 Tax=Roseibacillus ishigakijimensis TaxID=454146 RepID=A0A934RJT1_9BACT|nr:hypothetical protein [Roseibacillus ishigakijimensis]MBK1832987.1 hypothetical protein [Roseibacillus ishigakijimensis]
MSEESVYHYSKVRRHWLHNGLTLLLILLLAFSQLTFGESDHNFAPYAAVFLLTVNFRQLTRWESRWTSTVGPNAILYQSPDESAKVAREDLARILLPDGSSSPIALVKTNGDILQIPRGTLGNSEQFREALIRFHYPVEVVKI